MANRWWLFFAGWLVSVPVHAEVAVPNRIVSLDLCSDWLLAHYAQPHQSIFYSHMVQRYPLPEKAPHYRSHDGSVEQILLLEPDLVVVGEFNASMLRRRLQSFGIPVLISRLPERLSDIEQLEKTLLAHLGKPQTEKPRLPASAVHPSHGRLLLLGPNGYGTGRDTFEDSLIQAAGWTNYLDHRGHAKLDLEALATDPPDAIVWSAPKHPALANQFGQHPVFARTIPANRWIQTDYWRWQCPGPWVYHLIEQLQP